MNKIRDRMLARRESLQQRRQDFKERKQQAQPQKDYPPQFGEFERKAMQAWDEVSTTLKNEGGTPANCGTSFSGSDPRTAGGIPGLGDGEDVPLFERKKVLKKRASDVVCGRHMCDQISSLAASYRSTCLYIYNERTGPNVRVCVYVSVCLWSWRLICTCLCFRHF